MHSARFEPGQQGPYEGQPQQNQGAIEETKDGGALAAFGANLVLHEAKLETAVIQVEGFNAN